jgi:hypothetical protein
LTALVIYFRPNGEVNDAEIEKTYRFRGHLDLNPESWANLWGAIHPRPGRAKCVLNGCLKRCYRVQNCDNYGAIGMMAI